MSKLEELEEELYGKDVSSDLSRRIRKKATLPRFLKDVPSRWSEEKPKSSGPYDNRIFKYFFGSLAVILIVGAAVFLFLYLGTRGQEARITIYDRGPIEAGEILTIPVVIENLSLGTLKELEVVVELPENSLVIDGGIEIKAPPRIAKKIPDIGAGEESRIEVVVRMFGRGGEEKEVGAYVSYRPENLRARFTSEATKFFSIRSVPLSINWEVPKVLSGGQEVLVKVFYVSDAKTSFSDISFKVEYPSGFVFKSADPKPSVGDTIWNIGRINPGDSDKILIKGTINGEEGEIKAFRGELGVFSQLTKEWRTYIDSFVDTQIAVTPLSVQAYLGGLREKNIFPGERLGFLLRYKNNTPVVMRNVSVRAKPEGDILEFNSLDIDDGGVFEFGSRSLVWGPSNSEDLRVLDPGEGGELHFSIQTRLRPAVRKAEDKNLLVKLRSSIDVANIPEELEGTNVFFEENLEFRVRSKVVFVGKALFRSSPVVTAGPLPPKVGKKTKYAILWTVRNFTNDLHDVEIVATLPPNVVWENVLSPTDFRFVFDKSSGQVKLSLGEVKAGVGVLTPALTGAFLVSVTPSESDIGRSVVLINESHLSAVDSFTGDRVDEKVDALNTELREDTFTTTKDWIVVK